MDLVSMILIFVVMMGAMYFLMIRPANRRLKEQQAEQAALQPGDRVVLAAGILATVRHVGETTMVVELAPDVLITILKTAVGRKASDIEDEFEFEDEAPAAYTPPPGVQASCGQLVEAAPGDATAAYAGDASVANPAGAAPYGSYSGAATTAPTAGADPYRADPYAEDAVAEDPFTANPYSGGEFGSTSARKPEVH